MSRRSRPVTADATVGRKDPQVFVVSLLRTPERTADALRMLEDLDLHVEIVPAADGSADGALYFPRDARTSQLMQPGEVGICMSFWRVCARIVRENLPWAIYMEDDVQVLHLGGFKEALHNLPTDFHFAHISDACKPTPQVLPERCASPWIRTLHPSFTTSAYVISNSGARATLKSLAPFDKPVDLWLHNNDARLNVYQVIPEKAWFTQSFWRPSTARNTSMGGKIPHIIHRVWLGDKPIPTEYEKYWETWQNYHHGYEFHTWRDFDGCPDIPEGLDPAAQSDFVRLHVLQKYGGLYVDTDFECFHNFDKLIDSCSLLVADESKGILCNGIIASCPGHPLVIKMLSLAAERTLAGMPILLAAGPGLVRDVVDPYRSKDWSFELKHERKTIAWRQGDTGIVVIDSKTLFPYYWTQPKPSSYGDAWAAHHWGRSWWTPDMWNNFNRSNAHVLSKRFQ